MSPANDEVKKDGCEWEPGACDGPAINQSQKGQEGCEWGPSGCDDGPVIRSGSAAAIVAEGDEAKEKSVARDLVPTLVGAMIVGSLVFGIWPEMWKTYGLIGGWMAGGMLIGTAWFMNHLLGIIENPDGEVFIDMGFAVGGAGMGWSLMRFYPTVSFTKALPTLFLVVVGGVIAGCLAKRAVDYLAKK